MRAFFDDDRLELGRTRIELQDLTDTVIKVDGASLVAICIENGDAKCRCAQGEVWAIAHSDALFRWLVILVYRGYP